VCATRRTTADETIVNQAVVIDPGSGMRVILAARRTSGDLIAWREGDHYTVAPVR
jgi:hypothetical protein